MHLTETCDPQMPLIITSVSTTPATTTDGEMTSVIHEQLADKECLPNVHFVDSAYTTADNLADAAELDVDLCGPVAGDPSWQARAKQGFDIPHFEIDFANKTATCPNGTFSRSWREGHNRHGNEEIRIAFSFLSCLSCLDRPKCTRSQKEPRIPPSYGHNRSTKLYRLPVYVRILKNLRPLIKCVLELRVLSLGAYVFLAYEGVAI